MSNAIIIPVAVVSTLVLIATVWPRSFLPGIRRYRRSRNTKDLRYWHEWAVVIDPVSPPYDTKTLHSFRWRAALSQAGNPNHVVMSVAEAITVDRSRYAHRIVHLPDIDDPAE